MKNRSILWFRQDLRLHDNEALHEAIRWNPEVVPVYIFDPRVFTGSTRFGHPRMHPVRARFIIDSVSVLRENIRLLGSDLIVRVGFPEDEIFSLAKEFKTSVIFCNRERTRDEVFAQDRLESNLWTIGQEMRFTRGKMLYYTQDLPFPVTHTPDNFPSFRKELDRIVPVRKPLPVPEELSPLSFEYDAGDMPDLKILGLEKKEYLYTIKGGENEGIKRLKEYVWSENGLKQYRSKTNEINDPFYSSLLSSWLAQGCVSPKTIYHEIKTYESIHKPSEATQSLLLELLRRDYCRMIAKKYGHTIFERGGITGKETISIKDEEYLFNLWKESRLGIPILDAGLKALAESGYMPFSLRYACAHFLIHSLKVNWQLGADWFESNLVDYDPASNYVNWLSIAGLIPEPSEEKQTGISFLGKKLDPFGNYIKHWLPSLRSLPANKVFKPDTLDENEQKLYDFKVGRNYPKSIVPW